MQPRRRAAWTRCCSSQADPQAKALLLSCGAEGAAPLLASAAAYGDSKLTNKELRVLLRLRLGMLPHPGAPSSGICQRQGCGKPVDACGLHHLLCTEKGKGGMQGQRNLRHMRVKTALARTLLRLAREKQLADAVDTHEPCPSDYWPPEPGYAPSAKEKAAKQPRADLLVKGGPNGVQLLDLVITHPNATTIQKAATVPGAAAQRAGDSKERLYSRRWRVPEGDFAPFAVETGGRLDARARAFLASFVCMCIGKPRKEFTKEDLKWYARAMRELLDSVTVAVAKSVATTLLNASRVAGEDVAPEAGEVVEDGASEAG